MGLNNSKAHKILEDSNHIEDAVAIEAATEAATEAVIEVAIVITSGTNAPKMMTKLNSMILD